MECCGRTITDDAAEQAFLVHQLACRDLMRLTVRIQSEGRDPLPHELEAATHFISAVRAVYAELPDEVLAAQALAFPLGNVPSLSYRQP